MVQPRLRNYRLMDEHIRSSCIRNYESVALIGSIEFDISLFQCAKLLRSVQDTYASSTSAVLVQLALKAYSLSLLEGLQACAKEYIQVNEYIRTTAVWNDESEFSFLPIKPLHRPGNLNNTTHRLSSLDG